MLNYNKKKTKKYYKNFYLNYLKIFTYFKYKIDFKIINNSSQILISVNLSKIQDEKSSI